MGFPALQKGLCVTVCVLCFCFIFVCGVIGDAKVSIGENPIAKTDENFVCATLDLWPPTKCNYGDCPWGKSSFLNVDLNNKILRNAVKAFKPLRLRLGGTLQDKLVYQTDRKNPCDSTFHNNTDRVLGFQRTCLSLDRWDEINSFIMETGAETVFGLNALRGKKIIIEETEDEHGKLDESATATGDWDGSNSKFLIEYTLNKGYKIHGWTLGNELGGHTLFIGVSPEDYAKDTKKLHVLIEDIHKEHVGIQKPQIIAPGAIFDKDWYTKYVGQTPELHVATHHMYNLGAGDDGKLEDTILSASFLDQQTKKMFSDLQDIVKKGKTVAWIGESGGAFNSGKDGISNTFINGFWYLNMLGFAATHDTKAYCRQTLTGGNYGLLDTNTFIPNPDYYSALLWHRLMGKIVLSIKIDGTKNVYTYAHCAKKSSGITILVLNQDGKSPLKVSLESAIYGTTREEYHLTPLDGKIRSRSVMLNGKLLTVDPIGVIPPFLLEPATKDNSKGPIEVAPYSIVFVHLPQATHSACKKADK